MAQTVDIFVGSDAQLESFVRELESLLGVRMSRVHDDDEPFFESRDPHVIMTVGTHDLENDRDMNFEDFRYHIAVRAANLGSEEERRRWREEFARLVFEKLKVAEAHRLMLVTDLQRKVETFSPGSGQRGRD